MAAWLAYAAGSVVQILDALNGHLRVVLEGHTGFVSDVAFSPDGRALASASFDKTVRLWDATSGTPRLTLAGHQDVVTSVAFSSDGRALASASHDKTVRLWDTATGSCLAVLRATPTGFLTIAAGSPFFVAEGDLTRLLRFVSGDRIMPAELWAPLFHRPDLVEAALAGTPPGLATLGLDTYEACLEALQAERERRGLIRRRITKRRLPEG